MVCCGDPWPTIFPKCVFDEAGHRLYVNDDERARFLKASADESREDRVFCSALHHTGCRISEALELFPNRIQANDSTIIFRTLKKRRFDNQGNEKLPEYRAAPSGDRYRALLAHAPDDRLAYG